MAKTLKEFLIENKAYTKFLRNLGLTKKKIGDASLEEYLGCPGVPNSELINFAFGWLFTPEGFDYWNDLHNKWKDNFSE